MRLIAVSLVCAAAIAGIGQQTVFRTSVDLVHLDVSVLDRNRKPVRGLTAADFTILEDGQPRPVAAFAALEAKPAPPPAPADDWTRRVTPDVQSNEIARTPEGRLFVLLLDDALMPNDATAIRTVKEIAKTAIERLSPGDQMAVVFTRGSKGAQNFTGDRAKLLAAAATFTPGTAVHAFGWDMAVLDTTVNPPKWKLTMDGDTPLREASISTLEMVAESLIAAPQRRKAIIFVSPGVFADSEATTEVVMATPGESMMMLEANRALNGRLPGLYRRMRESNVTIYAMDPMGFGGMEAYVQRTSAGYPAMAQGKAVSLADNWYRLPAPPLPMFLAHRVATTDLEFLKTAAENTGGLAITDTNDLAAGVNRIFDENASYYLIGFTLPPDRKPGSNHRLQVKVSRPDVTVRTRSGYAAPEQPAVSTPASPAPSASAPSSATAPASKPAPTEATKALVGPVPSGVLPMRVALAPFADAAARDKKEAIVAFALGLDHLVAKETPQTFDVELRAFTNDGRGKLSETRTGRATLRPPPSGGDSVFDFLAQIALPPGKYEVRFGANLKEANLAGSVYADIDIPDFASEPVSLSGIVMEAATGSAGPLDALQAIIPIVPTSRRDFIHADVPQAFARIYQGGKDPVAPAILRVTIQNKANELIFNNRYTLPVSRFNADARAADFKFAIPTQALTTGAYLLTFEARLGDKTATRQVRFTFR